MEIMTNVRYVPKEILYPYFGYAQDGVAYVRDDLPPRVKEFVLVHELYHLQDPTVNVFLRELKANWAGFKKHPLGCLQCMIMSLSLTRLRLYIQRFKEGK